MVYLILLLFLLTGGVIAAITVENLTVAVHVILFGWQTPDIPLGLLFLFPFLLGALLLYAVSVASARSDKRRLKQMQQHLKELEQRPQQFNQAMNGAPMSPPPANTSALQMPGMYPPPRN